MQKQAKVYLFIYLFIYFFKSLKVEKSIKRLCVILVSNHV